ncbi:hypothetical protein CC2G_015009 [Coprinopsis cinerea AmutBmut pab1-1]|nr:hypothetical protein CC2G_015009 [Coprinopsis cinerea AmutBmut pab1-1]
MIEWAGTVNSPWSMPDPAVSDDSENDLRSTSTFWKLIFRALVAVVVDFSSSTMARGQGAGNAEWNDPNVHGLLGAYFQHAFQGQRATSHLQLAAFHIKVS